MSEKEKWATVSLRIHSVSLEPQFITSVLQTLPSRVSVMGERMSPRNPKSALFESHMWVLESQLSSEHSLDDHIKYMAEFIEQKQHVLEELLKQCQADIFCGYSSDSDQGSIYLDSEIMKKLTIIPLDLIFDIYSAM